MSRVQKNPVGRGRLYRTYIIAFQLIWHLYAPLTHIQANGTRDFGDPVVERPMLAALYRYNEADLCQRKIDEASCPSREMFVAVATHALSGLGRSQPTATLLSRLIDAEAWLDAAILIGALVTPKWRMRRLVLDDGRWLCSLSMRPSLPIELDDTVEASHDSAPLAVLSAILCADHRFHQPSNDDPLPADAQSSSSGIAMCCENYA